MKSLFLMLTACMLVLFAGSSWAAMDHGSHSGKYSDKAFLSGMLAHHEGALAMADTYLKSAGKSADAQVKEWAEDIKEAQLKEIVHMKALLGKAGGLDKAAYSHMEVAMADMLKAQKAASDATMGFVEHMTPHHAGAVEMSLPALLQSGNEEVVKLAKEIIQDQAEEIAAFRAWMSKHGH